ncbi:unnamed protein product [Linum trigynum]|uniref:Uncharacterized protein n=1 Tax=Linum trigynum TaxID=586398 RepID=A0AAV2GRM3_9ROSI
MKYQSSARVKRAQLHNLRREFEVLEMKTRESGNGYVGRVTTVTNEMGNWGEEMKEVKVVGKILRTLTERFDYVVCSIEESKDIDAVSIDALQASLLVHEQRFMKKIDTEE